MGLFKDEDEVKSHSGTRKGGRQVTSLERLILKFRAPKSDAVLGSGELPHLRAHTDGQWML